MSNFRKISSGASKNRSNRFTEIPYSKKTNLRTFYYHLFKCLTVKLLDRNRDIHQKGIRLSFYASNSTFCEKIMDKINKGIYWELMKKPTANWERGGFISKKKELFKCFPERIAMHASYIIDEICTMWIRCEFKLRRLTRMAFKVSGLGFSKWHSSNNRRYCGF